FDALKALPAQGDKPVSVIIRSHGAPRFVHDYIRERGFRLVDATCPFVGKIHRIVEEESKKGRKIIIIGNDKHPEVEGIKGWCTDTPVVIGSAEEAKAFTQGVKRDIPITVVAQTTFNLNKFQEIVEILEDYCYDDNTVNTICNATEARQKEAEELAGRMDAMLVVGGARSSNTQKLFEICSSKCKRTYFVQSAKELTEEDFSLVNRLGVTAGASTPNYIIEEIMDYVRVNFW
nr:4-hydroxy-3-methylbut-2-enyl diphosphate reductase [Lachnospiraceae bacterium]